MTGGECKDDKRNIMDTTTFDGTPFSVLMSQAVKLKTAQDAPSRSTFDSYPSFVRNSIFPREEVILARNKPFADRMEDAIRFKNDGNVATEEKCYAEAIVKYEIAASVFRYLVNCNSDWKTEGIRDADVKKIEFESLNKTEVEQVQLFIINCYINIAVVNTKARNYALTIDTCNEILRLDPFNVKALFLRSKAYVSPKSAGATEDDLAMKDLKFALTLEPENKILQKAVTRIASRRKHQLQKDRAIFGGLFDRGSIYEDIQVQSQKMREGNAPLDTRCNQLQFIDFDNPSQKVIEEAACRGIDLKNREVIQVLRKLQSDADSKLIKTKILSNRRQKLQKRALWQMRLFKIRPMWFVSIIIAIYSYFSRTHNNRNQQL